MLYFCISPFDVIDVALTVSLSATVLCVFLKQNAYSVFKVLSLATAAMQERSPAAAAASICQRNKSHSGPFIHG